MGNSVVETLKAAGLYRESGRMAEQSLETTLPDGQKTEGGRHGLGIRGQSIGWKNQKLKIKNQNYKAKCKMVYSLAAIV